MVNMLFVCCLCLLLFADTGSFSPIDRSTNSCGYESCPTGSSNLLNVHLVSHTHDDVGWLKTPDEYFYGARNYIQIAGVQYILDSVIEELDKDPNKRFIYVETSFFWKWWNSRDETIHQRVQNLVQSGRLEFISGGWSMNDEASTYYVDMIDQMTWGLRFLNDTFGKCGIPKVGWQIDPFGHSREQASLFAQMGFDGLFFGRLDYQDKNQREMKRTMEFLWNASANLGVNGQLFTGVLPNSYSPPSGFCFDLLCGDPPIMDNPNLKGYNVDERVDTFINIVKTQADRYATNHLIMTMGNDFNYQDAHSWFYNLDKLIFHVNNRQKKGSKINLFYSTPSCYLQALNKANQRWTVKTDDFFPYASDQHAYWTGYFTSRPTFKGYTKVTNNLLQVAKQLSVFANVDNEENLSVLKRFQGDAQHHDAITGTAKQVVAYDYSESLSLGQTKAEDAINNAFRKLLAKTGVIPPDQTFCRYLNVSYCKPTEESQQFAVTVYNPLGHSYLGNVRVPVMGAAFNVTDPKGNLVDNQLVPVPFQVLINPEKEGAAQNELVFQANLPASGFTTYLVSQTRLTQKNRMETNKLSDGDLVIQNKYLKVTVDGTTGLLKSVTEMNTKRSHNIQQNFYCYRSMAGDNMVAENRSSGAYIFRPNGTEAYFVGHTVSATLVKGSVVQEIRQTFSTYISQVIRLYPNSRNVEFEWLVGPLPVRDKIGREVISRFDTDLNTNGLFYTDSNGREVLERRRNYRPTWDLNVTEPIAGNYYPVNSRIFIQDVEKDIQLTIVTDRSQGGSSINDGSLELMVHRRLLHDDAFGVDEALDEPGVDSKGLRVRGKHYLLVSPIEVAPSLHRSQALKASNQPVLSIVPLPYSGNDWHNNFKTSYSGLSQPLPDNVHLVTLEPWKNNTVLIRLEHIMEKNDDPVLSLPAVVQLGTLFADFQIMEAKETTLGANVWLADSHRMTWVSDEGNEVNGIYGGYQNGLLSNSLEVTLAPMQIRTFVVRVERNK